MDFELSRQHSHLSVHCSDFDAEALDISEERSGSTGHTVGFKLEGHVDLIRYRP